MSRSSKTDTLGLGYPCCTGALCPHGEVRTDTALARALKDGGRELVLRGAPSGARFTTVVQRAREAGFGRIVLSTAGLDTIEDVASLDCVDVVRARLFSHVPAVHDRLTDRPGSLSGALFTLRRLVERGRVVEIEAPLLRPRLSDPVALVELCVRGLTPAAFRFFVPFHRVASALAPPPFDQIAGPLKRAIAAAEAVGAEVKFDPSQGVPLCAFGADADAHDRLVYRPRQSQRGPAKIEGREPAKACAECAVLPSCGGPTTAYRQVHESAGLTPFSVTPPTLKGESRGERNEWTGARKEAASRASFIVLRPTLHCNQDCLFCSANETSSNAFANPKDMLKAIARAAQRGVRRISFSGGEPTLSPHLASFVQAAQRHGVPEVEVVTNAVLLERKKRLRTLVDSGLTHAFVSLHAHDEALSLAMTQKVGDHEKTMRAIVMLLEAGVEVAVNHVITTRNAPYLHAYVERVSEAFERRVSISFAFVTPQYKALRNMSLVPRLSETTPFLFAAMSRAVELGQPFVVGSRQGVPPCMLGPFAAWSDVFDVASAAAAEDAPQKLRPEACDTCRYRDVCQGLWRPYVERYGGDEVRPIVGDPFTAEELTAIGEHHYPPPWGVPRSFVQVHESLRDRAAEAAPGPSVAAPVHLPVFAAELTRPVRVLIVGTGRRARRLAERFAGLGTVALASVSSPHAHERQGWWGDVPTFRSEVEAIEATDPDVALIACATEAHAHAVRSCARAGVPVLLEKPIARDTPQAYRLGTAVDGAWVSCALQEAFAYGIESMLEIEEGGNPLNIRRLCPANASDAPATWGRAPLFETLHHSMGLAVIARGPLVTIERVAFDGAGRPTRVSVVGAMARGRVEIGFQFDSSLGEDDLVLSRGKATWRRSEASGHGSEDERMLRAFVTATRQGSPPPIGLDVGIAVQEATDAWIEALEEAGAPLRRSTEPKHVASKRF